MLSTRRVCKFEIVKNVSARAYSGCAPGAVSILEVVSAAVEETVKERFSSNHHSDRHLV